MGDPHRALIVVSRCDVCEVQTSSECVRCKRPLCERHKPPRKQRCKRCEADYRERVKDLPTVPPQQQSSIEAARAKFRARPGLTWSLFHRARHAFLRERSLGSQKRLTSGNDS